MIGQGGRMKKLLVLLLAAAASLSAETEIPNPLIDAKQFQKIVVSSASDREAKRLTEAQFLAAMGEKGAVLLDARSAPMYALRHLKGAVNLPFTDFTADSLAMVVPDKTTKILIYCNNNFLGDQEAFITKCRAASLNLSTQASLRAYGYENIYELGPLLEVSRTAIPFAGTSVK